MTRERPPVAVSVTQTHHEPSATPTGPRTWALHVVDSPDPAWVGRRIELGSPVVLGRPGGGADLTIEDGKLSRKHVELRGHRALERFELIDRGSKNGTYVGGVQVQRASLAAGDVVRVGGTVAVFDAAAADDALDATIGGRSAALAQLLGELDRVAARPLPVLLLGETGTGKELLAQRLHARSGRSGDFVPVNCGAIVADLMESQFFGHRKGAFTGATEAGRGVLRRADGGTVFLDEVGEMPSALQPKLLRALETGELRPVGSTEVEHVDLRVVAATNVDLQRAMDAGTFRADLYARLAGYVIRVPPLRARRVDILPLLQRFVHQADPDRPLRLAPTLVETLLLHRWPMNVRELRTIALRLALREAAEEDVTAWPGDAPPQCEPRPDLRSPEPASSEPASSEPTSSPSSANDPGRGGPSADELRALLRRHDGSVARLAEHYGKARRQIYRWLHKHDIDPDRYRSDP